MPGDVRGYQGKSGEVRKHQGMSGDFMGCPGKLIQQSPKLLFKPIFESEF